MPSASSGNAPAVLLDTSVISGFVNAEMKPADAAAFKEMARLSQCGQLALYASTVTREEIVRIPLEFRSSHAEEYEALSKVKASQTAWVEGNVDSPSFGNMAEHPDFQALRRILKDKDDARLLFQTKMASIPSFVTLDLKTIRNKSAAIANLIGVEVFTPSEYLASTLRSA